MRQHLAGAPIAALLVLGLAACAQETEYATDEAADQPAYAETREDLAGEEAKRMADIADPSQQPTTIPVPNTGGVTPTAEEFVAIADIRVKDDAEEAAEDAFEEADLNDDGMLDRSEYLTVAMNAAPAPVPGAAMTDPLPPEDTASEETVGEGDIAVESPDTVLVDSAFAAAAGTDGELTKEELRTAFLARFEQADADNDAMLDEEERETFAALTIGEQPPTQTQPQE